jgi:hypothetical protein
MSIFHGDYAIRAVAAGDAAVAPSATPPTPRSSGHAAWRAWVMSAALPRPDADAPLNNTRPRTSLIANAFMAFCRDVP